METKALTSCLAELKKKMPEAGIKPSSTAINDFKFNITGKTTRKSIFNKKEIDLSQQGFVTDMVQRTSAIADKFSLANEEMQLLLFLFQRFLNSSRLIVRNFLGMTT